MVDDPNDLLPNDLPGLSHAQALEIFQAMVQALARIMQKEVHDDWQEVVRIEPEKTGVSELRSITLRAKWQKKTDLIHATWKTYKDLYGTPYGELKLIDEMFGDQLPSLPLADKNDVERRMEALKRRLGSGFENRITSTIKAKDIRSPIEQIFLIEWEHYRIERPHSLAIEPQHAVQAEGSAFRIDFLVTNPDRRLKVGVELDGHIFHEKTKEQVRRDKQRERKIVRQGITVLRFSGSEVIRNATACVQEVVRFLNGAA